MEHRRVGLVVVGAVDPARRDDPAGGAVRLHVADLHRRGVRAQHVGRAVVALGAVHVEGVVLLPGGVLGRDVEGVEIVPVGLDLRALGHGEAHVGEDRDDLLGHLADRVQRALAAGPRWRGHVDPFARQPGVERRGGQGVALGGDRLAKLVLQRVQRGAGGLALLGGHAAEFAHLQADLALLAEGGDAHVLERGLVLSGLDPVEIPGLQLGQPVHPAPSSATAKIRGQS